MKTYPLELSPDDNGTYLVTCPLLPEVTTFEEDVTDASANAANAIEEAPAARMKVGAVLPPAREGAGAALPALSESLRWNPPSWVRPHRDAREGAPA